MPLFYPRQAKTFLNHSFNKRDNALIIIVLKLFFAAIFIIFPYFLKAQSTATVFGRITDEKFQPLENVSLSIINTQYATKSLADGAYNLKLTPQQNATVVFSFIGYKNDTLIIRLGAGEKARKDIVLQAVASPLSGVVVEERIHRTSGLQSIDILASTKLPTASSGIEALLKTLPGVVSNNELSSQYSVRGGNFDENLVYVNDIEIYRPFLVRAGQQEGLSFINPDMVSSAYFSAGGFDAKYGDKMSSVLDIKYKQPRQFAASASLSLLGASAHIEGIALKKRLSFLAGARFKTNQYLLNALETKGDYRPSFLDVQSYFTYKISNNTQLSALGYVSSNQYILIPQSRQTHFGTYFNPLQLTIYFDGRENDKFLSALGAVSLSHSFSSQFQTKFTVSAYQSKETEAYDILGQYYLAEIKNISTAADSLLFKDALGIGAYLNHARNNLNVKVANIENRYSYEKNRHYLQWGIKFQHESINDKISEWQMIDSVGYSLPFKPGMQGNTGNKSALALSYSLKTSTQLSSNRYSIFLQDTWSPAAMHNCMNITFGARFQYADLNKQAIVSPRVSLSYKPEWKDNISFRFATGYYFQPPFYRELRNFEGIVNTNVKAQKSIQVMAGSDWVFKAWKRDFKYSTEVYYKNLSQLIPYEVDNVRIRYLGTNCSKGYAYGVDMKVNGEFIKGTDSWVSLSYLKTEEDIQNDFFKQYYNASGDLIIKGITKDMAIADSATVYPGYFPRPTDQRITFGMFIQDFLPMDPSFRVQLGLYFGSGLPTGAPKSPLHKHTLRLPLYRRVDIGLSKQFIGPQSLTTRKGFFKNFKALWATLEVLNLMQISNTVSYNWVKDINNNLYGVPNYLTPRQLNIKIGAEF